MLRRMIGEDIDLRIVPGRDLGRVKADFGTRFLLTRRARPKTRCALRQDPSATRDYRS
jgi:hypothetical protein